VRHTWRIVGRNFPVLNGVSEMNKFAKFGLAGVGALVLVQRANAAIDAAVTTAITGAQTDLLALTATLTGAGVAIWVALLIYHRFKPK